MTSNPEVTQSFGLRIVRQYKPGPQGNDLPGFERPDLKEHLFGCKHKQRLYQPR